MMVLNTESEELLLVYVNAIPFVKKVPMIKSVAFVFLYHPVLLDLKV